MHKQVQHCTIPLLVAISIGGAEVPALAQTQPNSSLMFEQVTLKPQFSPDPLFLQGISGGSVLGKKVAGRTETANGSCVGFVDTKPDHTLVITAFFDYLRLQVQSPEDTTLIVRGPGGSWCNDDFQGKNPGIAGEWLAGTYSVWVGSYKKSDYHPYTIRVTTKSLNR